MEDLSHPAILVAHRTSQKAVFNKLVMAGDPLPAWMQIQLTQRTTISTKARSAAWV